MLFAMPRASCKLAQRDPHRRHRLVGFPAVESGLVGPAGQGPPQIVRRSGRVDRLHAAADVCRNEQIALRVVEVSTRTFIGASSIHRTTATAIVRRPRTASCSAAPARGIRGTASRQSPAQGRHREPIAIGGPMGPSTDEVFNGGGCGVVACEFSDFSGFRIQLPSRPVSAARNVDFDCGTVGRCES